MTATTFQHRCMHQVTFQCGGPKHGKPTRKRCGGCGGGFVVTEGAYGVFEWRGDGGYKAVDAKSLHTRPSAADREAAKDNRLVVRFVTDVPQHDSTAHGQEQ